MSGNVQDTTIAFLVFSLRSTLQMLTNIETRLEELFEMLEVLAPEKVEAAEKVVDVVAADPCADADVVAAAC